MNPLEQLSGYLRRIERNLRMLTLARGFAVLCGCALALTVVLVLGMSQLSFSDGSVVASRVLLFFALAAALSLALVFPLLRLNQRRAARLAELRHPELGDRLLTFVERQNSNDAFLPLLAADALPLTAGAQPETIAAPVHALAFSALALTSAFLLLWLGLHGPSFFGYGTSLLWGVSPNASQPFYSISLQPGSARVRRHADQIVTARLNGFFSQRADLFVRYESATRWEQTAMRPGQDAGSFQYLLVGIPENVEYYVVSNGIHSATSRLTAVDLPQVTHLRVTYHFPAAYGRKDETEDPGGDLRAIAGTIATLEITTDKPLASGFVVLEDGSKIEIVDHQAKVPIRKDGAYHIATPDGGELVRLTDDYFIEARQDAPPVVTILRPARDARASTIEEVPVELQARDDNGVLALDLHYSVNGGPEQSRSVLPSRGAKDAHGAALLSLEDFKLVPGDVVSLYATARDALTTARSDIYFIEARPFEFTYRQDQASGQGSGSPGDEQPKIAERQKEIIAATFNQLKSGKHEGGSEAENAKYLSGVQAKLRDEAQSLADRSKARQLSGGSAPLAEFVKDMEAAIAVMGPASEQLKGQHWQDALSPEQKALQYLLRAESIFRDIQIQISRGGGGGGGQSGASRDLQGITNLELDTQKNQYESGSQSAEDERQKQADEALKKLEELARRQQELAKQQQSQQNFQQRWEQEMLRREAEQVRQKLEELARNSQPQQSSDGQQSQQSQQGQKGQQGQQGQQGQKGQQGQQGQQGQEGQQGDQGEQSQGSQQSSSSSPRNGGRLSPGTKQALDQALQSLSEATRDMGDAASHNSQSQAERAADQLNRAQSAISQMRQKQTGTEMGGVMDQARKLAERQQGFDERLRKNFGGGASSERSEQQNRQLSTQMSQEKQKEIDDLHQLEHAMQQAARGMQNTQPDAAKKLRDAIGEMQQNELESRMRWTVDALNKGMGSYAVMREAPVTMALNQLKESLGGAESAMTAGKSGDGKQAVREALDRAEKLHRDVEALARGNQPGDGKSGAPQPGGQQPGNESGKQAEGKQGGGDQPGQRSGTSARGGFGPAGPASGGSWDAMNMGAHPPDASAVTRSYDETMREMSRLGQSLRSDPASAREMQDLMRQLQTLDPRRFGADPQRLAALEQQIIAQVEQAELILRRNLDSDGGNVRTSPEDAVPPGYSDAVAEYFRRLSH